MYTFFGVYNVVQLKNNFERRADMAIKYKNGGKYILEWLKKEGYSSYKLRDSGLIGEAALTKIRNDKVVSLDIINTICTLLNCDITDVLVYERDADTVAEIKEKEEKSKKK